MPLDLTKRQTYLEWAIPRRSSPNKIPNAIYLRKFDQCVDSISEKYNGTLRYFESNDKRNSLVYIEGNPFFSLFKITPNGYFIDYFEPDDYWKVYPTDSEIIQKLLARNANKYKQTSKFINLNLDNYILFPMQRPSLHLGLLRDSLQWAKDNKRHIVFKTHPMPVDQIDIVEYWDQFNNEGLITEYSHLISDVNTDVLVDNCQMVWTMSSGVGTQALLKGKPVSYFEKDYDFTYGPIANYCANIDQAPNAKITIDDVEKYFSWYYHKFAIDMQAINYNKKIENRFNLFYNEGKSVEQLFG